MYSVISANEAKRKAAPGVGVGPEFLRLRFDWAASAAGARVAQAAGRFAGCAKRQSCHPYLDDPDADYGAPESALFRADASLPECRCRSQRMRNAAWKCTAAGFRRHEPGERAEVDGYLYRRSAARSQPSQFLRFRLLRGGSAESRRAGSRFVESGAGSSRGNSGTTHGLRRKSHGPGRGAHVDGSALGLSLSRSPAAELSRLPASGGQFAKYSRWGAGGWSRKGSLAA